VIIEPVCNNLSELGSLYEPLAERLTELWSSFSEDQLTVILDFIRRSNAFIQEPNARVRGSPWSDQACSGDAAAIHLDLLPVSVRIAC
jgi:hypothetical protein